jgi:hypothetical protein
MKMKALLWFHIQVSYFHNMLGTRFKFTSNDILKQKGVLCIGNKQLQKRARDTQAVHWNRDPHSLYNCDEASQ